MPHVLDDPRIRQPLDHDDVAAGHQQWWHMRVLRGSSASGADGSGERLLEPSRPDVTVDGDAELVIIDDGSVDESREWLESMIADPAHEREDYIVEHEGRVIGKAGCWRLGALRGSGSVPALRCCR